MPYYIKFIRRRETGGAEEDFTLVMKITGTSIYLRPTPRNCRLKTVWQYDVM
jgi:hypothetical protein